MGEWMEALTADVRTIAAATWQWLGANKDVAAVLVAISVPVLQRAGETKDRRVREAASLVSQYQAVHFLLCDIENDLRKPAQLATLPGGLIFDAVEGHDLLQRIHALEQRDLDAAAVIALFRGRSLVMTARHSLRTSDLRAPLPPELVKKMNENAGRAKLFKNDAYQRLVAAERRLAATRRSFWSSPIGKPVLLIRAWMALRGTGVKEPPYANEEMPVQAASTLEK